MQTLAAEVSFDRRRTRLTTDDNLITPTPRQQRHRYMIRAHEQSIHYGVDGLETSGVIKLLHRTQQIRTPKSEIKYVTTRPP
jgi:hypothetical protein